jgi:integrase
LVERLIGRGLSASTVHGAFLPVRAIFRREVALGRLAVNPTIGLALPKVDGKRDRVADPQEAAALIAALSRLEDRALWATSFYGGLRRGELQGLKWEDVDFAAGVIRVERAWDEVAGFIDPKTTAGRRAVPLAAALRGPLLELHLKRGRPTEGLVFARPDGRPFNTTTITKRTFKEWEGAGLERITLHEARHTAASYMIAAGINIKALSSYLGHASVAISIDLYGHLFAGNEAEAAGMLDGYLDRAAN